MKINFIQLGICTIYGNFKIIFNFFKLKFKPMTNLKIKLFIDLFSFFFDTPSVLICLRKKIIINSKNNVNQKKLNFGRKKNSKIKYSRLYYNI